MKLEDAVRLAIRQRLNEAVQVPVSVEAGTALHEAMKSAMVSRDDKTLVQATRQAIRSFKMGDRADQKLAQNLRAFQGSIKSGRSNWPIAELAFAEWMNKRRMNPVVTEVTERERVLATLKPSPNSPRVAAECSECGEMVTVQDLFMSAYDRGIKINLQRGYTGFCPSCGGSISSDSLKKISESKKTELETIYESIESFARRNNTKTFDVIDQMMLYCETIKKEEKK
jgi:hypothetical protein